MLHEKETVTGTQRSDRHISLGITDQSFSSPFPVAIDLLLECGTQPPIYLLSLWKFLQAILTGERAINDHHYSKLHKLHQPKLQDHGRFLSIRFQGFKPLWHFKGNTSLVVGYFEKFESEYSPQARWVPSLLSHKHIAEPEGTSKRRDMFAKLSWM